MNYKLLSGPLLSLEEENIYSVCFLTNAAAISAQVKMNGKLIPAKKVAETATGFFWRMEEKVNAETSEKEVSYEIEVNNSPAYDIHERKSWQFYIPAIKQQPNISYASCNGFSASDLLKNAEHPHALWEEMMHMHEKNHFSILLMGGDQVYADELWSRVQGLKEWIGMKMVDQVEHKATPALVTQLDLFFEGLYIEQWSEKSVSLALASIPTVMMWDDHDIFDGWGSYPEAIQTCPVYKAIFNSAKKHYEIFQMRKRPAARLLDPENNFSFALHYRQYTILAMDHRSQRSLNQVMAETQWQAIINWFKEVELRKNLLIMSAVPVVYRDFGSIEFVFDHTRWSEELTDDLMDHWRAKEHQGERLRLIQQLLAELRKRTIRYKEMGHAAPDESEDWHTVGLARTIILSGDVHIGALGIIMDRRENISQKIHQVIASGIVHPSPTFLEWAGVLAITNDRNEYLNEDKTLEAAMLKPIGSNQYIRARNFATLKEGSDKKLWINWINESKDKAEYPLE